MYEYTPKELLIAESLANHPGAFARSHDLGSAPPHQPVQAPCSSAPTRPSAAAVCRGDRRAGRPPRHRSRWHGATEEEVDFLLDRRVELNALASDQLVAFIERKLV